MMRPLSILLLAFVPASAVDLTLPRYRKPIALTADPKLAAVKLDREVYSAARTDLGDLRVFRDSEEIATTIVTLGAAADRREETAEITDQSVTPEGLQLTLHLSDAPRHNSLRIVTSEQNFRQTVRIETSDDRRQWAIARDDGAIFDFTQGARRLSSLMIDYPVSTRRYLRVTIRGWMKVGAVTGAMVEYQEERSASRETFATLTPIVTQDGPTQSTLAMVDLGIAGLPVDRLAIDTPAEAFHRAVDIEASDNARDWRTVTQGVIERWSGHSFTAIAIQETHDRYLRLRVYNRDDRPIEIRSVRLDGLIREIRFFALQPGNYWLYYGAAQWQTPSYDLAAVVAREGAVPGAQWTLGPQQANQQYLPPAPPVKPWSERHPGILYTVLGGAIVGLAIATLRFAMRIRTPPAAG